MADVPGPRVMRGRDAVIAAFQGLLEEFPDWRVEPQQFIEAGQAVLVRNVGTATGRESGVPIRQEFTQVWTFRDGRPVLVREFIDHAEAVEAAGGGGVRRGIPLRDFRRLQEAPPVYGKGAEEAAAAEAARGEGAPARRGAPLATDALACARSGAPGRRANHSPETPAA